MDQQGAIDRIRSVPLFSECGDKELQRVAAIVKEVEGMDALLTDFRAFASLP